MNNVKRAHKKGKSTESLRRLSVSIGDFIRYWGFRRVHGAIWTQLYLSPAPLNCTDLTERLGVSKSLISPALEELCDYRLISEVPGPNEKVKLYQASHEIEAVIRHILETREKKIIETVSRNVALLKKDKEAAKNCNQARLQQLELMTHAAEGILNLFFAQKGS